VSAPGPILGPFDQTLANRIIEDVLCDLDQTFVIADDVIVITRLINDYPPP
jgi:non-ribosomal peptide synthetase component E (peptide arylation enzyme)